MEDILKAAGVTDVYACGIATDVCVGNKRTSSRFRKHTKTLKYDSNKNQLTQHQHSGIEQLPFNDGAGRIFRTFLKFTIIFEKLRL